MSWWDTYGGLVTALGAGLADGYASKRSGEHNQEIASENAENLIKLLDLHNNPNTFGVFGGWQQQIGPDGRLNQVQMVNPQMQEGLGHFIDRFNTGGQDPQMQELKNALFDRTMDRSGPSPMPERRQRPRTAASYTDDEGNSIRPANWWHGGL